MYKDFRKSELTYVQRKELARETHKLLKKRFHIDLVPDLGEIEAKRQAEDILDLYETVIVHTGGKKVTNVGRRRRTNLK